MLHKPILPVVMETVGWPPPGGMAVILSQLVHIDMKGERFVSSGTQREIAIRYLLT